MSNCRIEVSALKFSVEKSESRFERATSVLGEKVVGRLLAFGLFLLGAERQAIASSLGLPLGTLLSLLTRVGRVGLPAFEDRRRKRSEFLPAVDTQVRVPSVRAEDGIIVIDLDVGQTLHVPSRDCLQARVVLLTLVNNKVLTSQLAAEGLGCTAAHVRTLCRELDEKGAEALLDKRRGQKRDYRITPEVKSELVSQAAAHALTGNSTSSAVITDSLNKRMGWQLAERTVRLHMQKLGLAQITESLPSLVESLKKTPQHSAEGRDTPLRCNTGGATTTDPGLSRG